MLTFYKNPIAIKIANNTLNEEQHSDNRNIVLAKLLYENTKVDDFEHVIKWDLNTNKTLILKDKDGKYKQCYNKLIDTLTYIDHLEREGYILLTDNNYNNKVIYDPTMPDASYETTKGSAEITIKETNKTIPTSAFAQYSGLANVVNNYANKYVYPTTKLKILVENQFKTPEQIRHEKQTSQTKKQIWLAAIAVVISISSIFISKFLL